MVGRRSPEEQRSYSQGYAAGRRRSAEDRNLTLAGVRLFEALVEGLVLSGMSLDQILAAQIAGAKKVFGGEEVPLEPLD